MLYLCSISVSRRQGHVYGRPHPGSCRCSGGSYHTENHLVATSVKFKGTDLERARPIQAGMHDTAVQTQQNEAELAKQNEAEGLRNGLEILAASPASSYVSEGPRKLFICR
jgi:hypothetical protein